MAEEPENLMLRYLRRLDEQLGRVVAEVQELKYRMSALAQQVGNLAAAQASQYAVLSARLDRVEVRLDRVERRLDLVEHPLPK